MGPHHLILPDKSVAYGPICTRLRRHSISFALFEIHTEILHRASAGIRDFLFHNPDARLPERMILFIYLPAYCINSCKSSTSYYLQTR